MIFRFTIIFGCLFYFLPCLIAQESVTISGTVTDSITESPLEAVSVSVVQTTMGTYTDQEGKFSLTINQEFPVKLNFSYIGYKSMEIEVASAEDAHNLRVGLFSTAEELAEVIVQASSLRERFHSSNTSVETIDAREAQVIPALFGEVDIIKTLQLKPGILSGSEGNSNLYVRGGNGDQNLVLLDGVNIYNP